MKVSTLAKILDCKIVCGLEGEGAEISGCYIGDLLSLAMSKVQKDYIWITIQSNINVVAVASLTEAGCILLCDAASPDENTIEKAKSEGIPLLTSDKSAYEIACILAENGI